MKAGVDCTHSFNCYCGFGFGLGVDIRDGESKKFKRKAGLWARHMRPDREREECLVTPLIWFGESGITSLHIGMPAREGGMAQGLERGSRDEVPSVAIANSKFNHK